jgi:predicted RNA binding protein YcfA (HicA-like mRNA interferase family)
METVLNVRAWRLVRINGSHHIWKSEDGSSTVVVPFHRGDLAPGTQRTIMRVAGLTDEDL